MVAYAHAGNNISFTVCIVVLPVFSFEIFSAGLGGSAFHPGAVNCIVGFAGRGAGC